MTIPNKYKLVVVVTIGLLIGAYAYMANSIQPLPEKWVKLFKEKSAVVTQYAEQHPIHLSNVLIENQDLSKSTYPNAEFKNTVWNNSVAIGAHFVDAKFIGGSITDSGFSDSVFTNVVFDGVTFNEVEFISSTFINTTFKNCRIYNSELHNLEPSTFTIEDSELNKVNFFESTMDLTLKNTRIIEEGMFGGLKAGSKITLDHSYIGPYSDFSSQKGLTSFTAKNSELNGFGFSGTINKFVLDSSKLYVSIGGTTTDIADIINSNISDLDIGSGKFMRNVTITDCKSSDKLEAFDGNIGELTIRNCDFNEFEAENATIEKLNIVNSKIGNLDFKQLKAGHLTLQNVSIEKQADFSNAIAKESKLVGVTFNPTATLNITDSNIPLKR